MSRLKSKTRHKLLQAQVSFAVASVMVIAASCKTISKAHLAGDKSVSKAQGEEFIMALSSQVQWATKKLMSSDNSAPSGDQDSEKFKFLRAFASENMLTPYSDAAAATDQRANQEYSRNLATAVKSMLTTWHDQCSRSSEMKSKWAYPALCQDFSKTSILDEAINLSLINKIITAIEKERGMPAHLAIYYEMRYVSQANQKTLEQLNSECTRTPLNSEQSQKIAQFAQKLSHQPAMNPSEIQNAVKTGLINQEQIRYLDEIVSPANDVLFDAMTTYNTDLELYKIAKLGPQASSVSETSKWAYEHGRRSVITDDYYYRNLKQYENSGIYTQIRDLDFDDFSHPAPNVSACASVNFKVRYNTEVRNFFRDYLSFLVSETARQGIESKYVTFLILRMMGGTLGQYVKE